MSSFHVSRRSADEAFAEGATTLVVGVALAAFVAVGAVFVGILSELTRIWGQHAAPGQPSRPVLLRGMKLFLGSWALACLLALTRLAPVAALLGFVSTGVFVVFILIVGARADHLIVPPKAGELDTYLAPFAAGSTEEAAGSSAPPPSSPRSSTVPVVPLRVLPGGSAPKPTRVP